jgi:hypothetical protein
MDTYLPFIEAGINLRTGQTGKEIETEKKQIDINHWLEWTANSFGFFLKKNKKESWKKTAP